MTWETKDSGKRAEYASGMVRDTQDDKARWDLMIPEGIPYSAQLMTRVAELMTRGADKYGLRNWEKADSPEEIERFRGSAYRHFMQWFTGELDEDHAAAVIFNLLAAESTEFKVKRATESQRAYIQMGVTGSGDEEFSRWLRGFMRREGIRVR